MKRFILLLSLIFCSSLLPFAIAQTDSLQVIVQTEIQPQAEAAEEITLPPAEAEEKASEPDATPKKRAGEDLLHAPDVSNVISLNKVFWSVIFIILGYFLIKGLSVIINILSERNPRFKAKGRRLLPVIRILGWSLIIYIIVSGIIKPPTETVFAFFASIGVAVGFASQDLLKNVFGGLMILFDKPFQVGDKIEVGKYYGEVIQIGLRTTRVVTPDDSVVSVPNSEMIIHSISNANSGENNCQVVAEIYLPTDIDTRRVRQVALETAQVSRFIFLNKPIAVEFFNEMNNRGPYLKMRLKAYVLDVTYEFPFKSEMTEIVIRELYKEGLVCKEW